jgi:hypothetical protein
MNLLIIASIAIVVILVALVAVLFRPSKGFKPNADPSGYTMSADKPLVLRFPGSPEDGADGEVRDTLHSVGDAPRDMLFQIGDAPPARQEPSPDALKQRSS